MKRSILALSALGLASPAVAADLPSRYAPPPYYDPAPPIFTWNGLYAGLNGQFAVGSFDGGAPFGSPIGGFGGGTLGYNYQQGKLLVGVEGDIAYGSYSSTGGAGLLVGGATANVLGTARARVGYVWNQAMVYVTGGYAGTSLDGHVADFGGAPGLLLSEQHYLNGYTVGAGLEYAFTTKMSVKAEYLYAGFGSASFFNGTRDARSVSTSMNLLRLGVNYHF